MLSQSIEDYLKTIFEIENREGKVSNNSISEKLCIMPASVTNMVKKLSEKKLITHERYQGVKLTDSGKKIALEIVRHHRLIELYLKESLGVPWDQVHDEAEKWEHVLSDELEDRIDEFLGYPTSDPHGSPIPNKEGFMEVKKSRNLVEVKPPSKVVIAEVSDHDSELLRYLGKMGLYPNTEIEIVSVEPFQGPITVVVNNKKYSISREAAKYISVADLSE